MASTWVLVADNSEARVYDFDRHKKTLTLIDEVEHEEGRWKNQAFVSSGPGHTITSSGNHTSRAVGTDASPKAHESHNFAHMIGTSINHAYDLHRFDTINLCAPPKLLGEILPEISKNVPQGEHINKDLVKESDSAIVDHLLAQAETS